MSMNHHRHTFAGTSALAAQPAVTGRSAGGPQSIGPGRDSTLPANVVELRPGAATSRRRRSVRLKGSEAGMATAEYAIATLAAVGFAGLLVFILRSDEVRGFLLNLIRTALALP
ncbi:hypothetical protein Achl_3158 [Pseudarthrobacter chlorophenolicus A6]|uniref:DUF4244 domain-containing protein n=1 Tax=Pseudarthrobacter chlorophenolicus (strain ATCC 700700 / DSM 12829 / CIP 107037 / JCM 12360 / KCTC 9906 / NCIMB 13794 / A6) TaxID=452863 RepID=B8HFS6_PSECP|nr:DUF4244 domain-containing protein [Pseudarthrobacter chlorophenolicus]ACL41119.1 hypothetical protein Achl_3158 [Pseudarthrobacter chlorophenolicus A6]SDQ69645.1 Protein of unknown function [Pseudarthrobacter chlorophenolicus]